MTQLQTATPTAATRAWSTVEPTRTTTERLEPILKNVSKLIAPVWPLGDYVAVNPYQGLSDRRFLDARDELQSVSDCETLMPIAYYREQYSQGQFGRAEIEAAIAEYASEGLEFDFTCEDVINRLAYQQSSDADTFDAGRVERPARLRPLSDHVGSEAGVNWSETIRDEISKHFSAHYDEGQAIWSSPWKDLPLYEAWRQAALHDRNVELLGIEGFRWHVSQLPETPEASIARSLDWLGVPEPMWESFLSAQALSIPGWSAYARYRDAQEEEGSESHFKSLLAIRLAYDAGLSDLIADEIDWQALQDSTHDEPQATSVDEASDLRMLLLRAQEIAYRNRLLDAIEPHQPAEPSEVTGSVRKLAQMVFCIDVRSERIRRHLEEQSSLIETFGFAGFFGMPIESVSLGADGGSSHVPVLLKPQFKLREGIRDAEPSSEAEAVDRRRRMRTWRKLWKRFQGSAVSCFSFVESTGLLYGIKLLRQTAGWTSGDGDSKWDGVGRADAERLGPTLRGLNQQGITTSHQVDLAEGMLRNLGLVDNFARLVVFCGHASQTTNNPLAASLDCGACGGHSGEPNARFAAMLLNQSYIRTALAERGILIPEDTHFLAGVHNTTIDAIDYFDLAAVPPSHRRDLEQLADHSASAGKRTNRERMPIVASASISDIQRRAIDWSEVRPEWGLAGNAAFVVAPRSVTRGAHLDGQAFLHSYDYRLDPDGNVLELIMTAPMIVAHWINMQYYASTVDPKHFGSGNKTLHNVVGRFGILSGNSGDLTTGMPWQSVHTGKEFQHKPLRLQSVVAAPRESIDRIIDRHAAVADLLNHGWMHLIAIDEGDYYRYQPGGTWQRLASPNAGPKSTELDSEVNRATNGID